jgi:NADPH:quinone reductase-like Zn-dependent oxidoreductase
MSGIDSKRLQIIFATCMKAFTYSSYGGLSQFRQVDLPKPIPAADEVLVAVKAVSINDWDWEMMKDTLFNRLISGLFRPKFPILGSDISGVIEAVGPSVQHLKIGDRVFGDLSGRWGGFAQYVCCKEKQLCRMPSDMRFEQAAALPQAGELAIQALLDEGALKKGQDILINGAGGGVGTIGIQICKPYAVNVTVVDRMEKLEMLRLMGGVRGIDYTREDFTSMDHQFDLILDTKTNRPLSSYLKVLKTGGKYVTVGGSISRLFKLFFIGKILPAFSSKRVNIVALKANKDLQKMSDLFMDGALLPVIDGPYTFDELPIAMKIFSEGKHKGKMVIRVDK